MGIEFASPDTALEEAQPLAEPRIQGEYIATVSWFARRYSRPFAKAAIERKLPSDYEKMDRSILVRALRGVGLKSQFVTQDIADIDSLVLPCALFSQTGKIVILLKKNNDSKTVTISRPQENYSPVQVPIERVQSSVVSEVLLVTLDSDSTDARSDPDTIAKAKLRNHWLWQPLRQHRGAWVQIFIAAMGSNILALALPIFVMNVYDRVIPNLAMVTLWTLAIGVAIALLLDLLLRTVRTNVLELAGRRIDLQVASTLFQQAMDVKILERKGGAAGIASQIRDFESVREFFSSSSFVAMIDLLFVGLFVFVLWVIVGPIAIVPLLAVPVVVILALIAQVPIGISIEKSQQLSAKRHLVLIESLLGIEAIKSVNGEPVMQREWENAVAASSRISSQSRFWSTFAISGTMLVQQAVSVTIILWGVYLVAEGRISIGGLIAANILAGRVLAPLGNISQTLLRAQQASKSLAAIDGFMNLPTEGDDSENSELSIKKGEVEFRNLEFTYPEMNVAALEKITFDAKPGEIIGILGRVGSGKTTLGKILAGFMAPTGGTLLIDKHEIQQYEPSMLREGVGYLPQDPELFTGTIRENLILGKPDADEEEINEALHFASMDYFISENPEGLNQFVGEKGNRLSGGQRQAISLARLLLRKPKIMFLDEPTNAMDHTTEANVIDRLKELANQGVTLIVSTHRHSFANVADRLIVLDQGKIIMAGPRKKVLDQLAKPISKKKP